MPSAERNEVSYYNEIMHKSKVILVHGRNL